MHADYRQSWPNCRIRLLVGIGRQLLQQTLKSRPIAECYAAACAEVTERLYRLRAALAGRVTPDTCPRPALWSGLHTWRFRVAVVQHALTPTALELYEPPLA